MTVGFISDTHDLVRSEAVGALAGVDRIVHCGDICSPAVIEALARIAPVHAVRGNCDRGPFAASLPASDTIDLGAVWVYVVHDLADLDISPLAAGVALVAFGHSHRPLLEDRGGVLFLNPGSAGPRRFSLPVSLARACIENGAIHAELVSL